MLMYAHSTVKGVWQLQQQAVLLFDCKQPSAADNVVHVDRPTVCCKHHAAYVAGVYSYEAACRQPASCITQ